MAEAQKQEREELAHRAGHGYVFCFSLILECLFSFPLVIDCDMQEEMSSEASDAAVTGNFFRIHF